MDKQSDSVEVTPFQQSGNPGLSEVWEQRISETDRLYRFFSKLLGEVVHIGADEVEFVRDGEVLSGAIRKDRKSIKSITVRSGWLPSIVQFLGDRILAVCGHTPPLAEEIAKQTDFVFRSALAFDDRVIDFKVSKQVALSGRHRLTLSDFTVIPRGRILDFMFGGLHIRDACERLLRQVTGVTIVGAPDQHQLRLIVKSLQAISGVTVIGDAEEPKVSNVISGLSRSHHVVVTTIARDITEVAARARAMGIPSGECDFRGFICNAFVRRSCEGCSKKALLSPQIVSELPDYLGQLNSEQYVVGRGCDACGQSGFTGFVGLQGAIIDDTEILPEAVVYRWNSKELIEQYYSKGMRSLLEDGVRKALAGSTTIESVLQVARTVPDVYRDSWNKNAVRPESSQPSAKETDSALLIPEDFFVQRGNSPEITPAISRQLPFGNQSSQPLFEAKKATPKRDRPLVLIVEDDPDQRSIVELTLKSANYDVIQAGHGGEALELLETETPDLIISDLMMPVMDGGEFVMRCKSTPRLHKIPILMLTVVADEEREYALLDMGADDYCEKTIQRKLLLKRIEKLVQRASVEAAWLPA